MTFSWQKLTYLGTEDSDRKTDIKFGFSVSDLHRKHIFSSKKFYKKSAYGLGFVKKYQISNHLNKFCKIGIIFVFFLLEAKLILIKWRLKTKKCGTEMSHFIHLPGTETAAPKRRHRNGGTEMAAPKRRHRIVLLRRFIVWHSS